MCHPVSPCFTPPHLIDLVIDVETLHVDPVVQDGVDELVGRGVLPKQHLDLFNFGFISRNLFVSEKISRTSAL